MSVSSVNVPVRPSVCSTLCMPMSKNVCPSVCSVNCFYTPMHVYFLPVSLRASVRVLNLFSVCPSI